MRLKVSSANFFVGNKQPVKDANYLASLNCDLNGIQEGHSGNAEALKKTLGDTHVVFWGNRKDAEKDFAMQDVPVVYKKSLKTYKHWARLISHRAQKKNIGMPRAATAVRFEKEGVNVTFINTHCNAAVQNRETGQPFSRKVRRVAEFIAGMIVLEQMIKNAQKRGDKVVLVGDLNYAPTKAGIWRYSPQAMFKRRKMHYRNHRIDYIGYSREFKPSNFTVIPQSKMGSDHDWITLNLE